MNKAVSVTVDCNRGSDGCFTGKCTAITFRWKDKERHYYHPNVNGVRFSYGRKTFSIAKQTFEYLSRRIWPGSWCCEEFFVSKEEAKRLYTHIEGHGWELDEEVEID